MKSLQNRHGLNRTAASCPCNRQSKLTKAKADKKIPSEAYSCPWNGLIDVG